MHPELSAWSPLRACSHTHTHTHTHAHAHTHRWTVTGGEMWELDRHTGESFINRRQIKLFAGQHGHWAWNLSAITSAAFAVSFIIGRGVEDGLAGGGWRVEVRRQGPHRDTDTHTITGSTICAYVLYREAGELQHIKCDEMCVHACALPAVTLIDEIIILIQYCVSRRGKQGRVFIQHRQPGRHNTLCSTGWYALIGWFAPEILTVWKLLFKPLHNSLWWHPSWITKRTITLRWRTQIGWNFLFYFYFFCIIIWCVCCFSKPMWKKNILFFWHLQLLSPTYVSISVFLQVLGRPAVLPSTFSPLLVDGLPEWTNKQIKQINDGINILISHTSTSFFFSLLNSPAFDHLENSRFTLESGNVLLLLLLLERTTNQTFKRQKNIKDHPWLYDLSVSRWDTYFTVVSLDLSPEQGITSVSVYLTAKVREHDTT